MICPPCRTRNPIGNKFCRECGSKLDVPGDVLQAEEHARVEAERKRERVAILVAEAWALSEQDKPAEALARAEEAASLQPDSTSTQALLAALYERLEQTDKAIAAMEKVVLFNPDSAADQEKLEQLRRGVHVLPVRNRATFLPRPRSQPAALMLSGAVAASVLGIGLWLVNKPANPSNFRKNVATDLPPRPIPSLPQNTTREDPFAAVPVAPLVVAPPAFIAQTERTPAPALEASAQPSQAAVRAAARRIAPASPARTAATEPFPTEMRWALTARTPRGRDVPVGETERVVVRPPRGVSWPNTAAIPEGKAEGGRQDSYIRIHVGPPAERVAASAARPEVPHEASSEGSLLLRAQSLQAGGNYREAVTAYDQALGVVPFQNKGDVYQGLALSQQRLGNEEAARSAYQQAIAAYETQAAAGRGTDAARRGIASCRAALEVLGSG